MSETLPSTSKVLRTDLRGATIQAHVFHSGEGDVYYSQTEKAIATSKFKEGKQEANLWNSLLQSLKTKALEVCGEEDQFRGDKIAIVPLQISTKMPGLDEALSSGHGHRREDIINFFKKEPRGNISHTELFVETKRFAKENAGKCYSQEAKEKFLQRYGNYCVISGQPGIGKTTFTKRLVEEMWTSDPPLFNPDIVFYIRCRDVDYDNKYDLLHFLAPFFTDVSSKKERIKILKKLEENENVFIIMDGLDEAVIDPNMTQFEFYSLDSVSTAEGFIQNLLAGNILPKSKKLITSRPYRLAQLPKEFKPKVLFNIQGLDDKAIKKLCENICDNINSQNKILDHLQNHPDLKSYCHTPVICIMVLECLNSLYESEVTNALLVTTLTGIFVFVLKDWILEKLQRSGKFQIEELAKLAFTGFLADQYYFTEFDLRKAGIDFYNNTSFLYTKFPLLRGTRILYFLHLMWQEFFSAVFVRLYMSQESFEEYWVTICEKPHKFEVMLEFLYGLCNQPVLINLLDFVEVERLNTETDRNECKEMLKGVVLQSLRDLDEKYPPATDGMLVIGSYFYSILPLLKFVCEMGENQSFLKEAAECLKEEIDIFTEEVLPYDVANINHFLRARDSKLILKLIDPHIAVNYAYFFKELAVTLKLNRKIQVKRLYLDNKPLDADTFHHVLSCTGGTKRLSFINCNVTNRMVSELVESITKREQQIEKLDISENPITDEGYALLVNCIYKIEELVIHKSSMSRKMKTTFNNAGRNKGCEVDISFSERPSVER